MKLPWPELPSAHRPDESIRDILDYLCWVSEAMRQDTYRAGADLGVWRGRVQQAYQALFLPPVPNHGDPYPPDVPPPRNPGIWPDIPSAGVPGMTLRHQLKVINIRSFELRKLVWVHARETEVAEWDRRLSMAREVLEQGEGHSLPEEARTHPSEDVLAEARAQEEAMKEHARKRALRLQRLKARTRKQAEARKKAAAEAKKEAASKKAAPKKAPPKKEATAGKKAPPKKKAPPRKKAPARKKAAPKKKSPPKPKASPKAKKKPAKKKAAPRARKKAAPKAKKKAKAGTTRATK